jgi:hypothetical protein
MNNQLEDLPLALAQVENLEMIGLYKNRLTVVPEVLFYVKYLTKVQMGKNAIPQKDLSNAIEELPNVKIYVSDVPYEFYGK